MPQSPSATRWFGATPTAWPRATTFVTADPVVSAAKLEARARPATLSIVISPLKRLIPSTSVTANEAAPASVRAEALDESAPVRTTEPSAG